MLEKLFHLKQNGTRVSTEMLAGATTFMTMSYIVVVQPSLFSQAGIDFGAVLMATCLSAALASLVMGLWANYPVALAPGMGENFFFIYTVVLGLGVSWQQALGMVFLSGVIFILLSFFNVRQIVLDAIPNALRHAITAGIGSFILVIGLGHAGVLVRDQALWSRLLAPEGLPSLFSRANFAALLDLFRIYGPFPGWDRVHWVALAGLTASLVLIWRNVRGALLLGMLAAGILAYALDLLQWNGLLAAPPDISPTLFKLDLGGLFTWKLFPLVLVFLFMVLFDTIGTLVGVSEQAGLTGPDGRLPRAKQALMSDAIGTTAGALLGTSTVTSYIESAAGVQAGGRTGLTAVVCALFFLLATLFSPLAASVGSGILTETGIRLYPVTASALIIVGSIMLRSLRHLKSKPWQDWIPGAMVVLGIPITYSIADGLALGFIAYPLLHLCSGQGRKVSWLVYVLGTIFILRYLFL